MTLLSVRRLQGIKVRGKFKPGLVIRLGGASGITPAYRVGNPGSNPGPGKNFSLNGNNIYLTYS